MKRLLIPLIALSFSATPALAHKLKLFVQAEGATIVGTAYFAGGGKAMNSTGTVTAPDGRVVATFTTDDTGRFSVPVSSRQDYRVHIDSGDGHVAEATLHADELPESLPADSHHATVSATPVPTVPASEPAAAAPAPLAAAQTAAIEAAIAHQLRPLREQIDQMEERARFSDIMGGVGTIFGIFGVAAWIAARRRIKA